MGSSGPAELELLSGCELSIVLALGETREATGVESV
jgi:hypothetical protein